MNKKKPILILVLSLVIVETLSACSGTLGRLNATTTGFIRFTETVSPTTPVLGPGSPSVVTTVTKINSPKPSPTKRVTSTATLPPTPILTSTITSQTSATARPTPSYSCNRIPDPQIAQSRDSQDRILMTGEFVLCELPGKRTFDLDKGILGVKDTLPLYEWKSNGYKSETDIALEHMFSEVERTVYYLISPINGASIYRPGTASISLDDCQAAIALQESKSFLEGNIGNEACLLTGEGHIAIIRVEQVETYGFGSIVLSFTTYNQPLKK